MSDRDDADFRRRLRGPARPGRAALVLVFVIAWVALTGVVGYHLTAPWPRRGPGGGEGANLWGPIVTMLVAAVPAVVVAWVVRRR